MWIGVNEDGREFISQDKPERFSPGDNSEGCWLASNFVMAPKGLSRRLLGNTLTWKDEPVEIKENDLK